MLISSALELRYAPSVIPGLRVCDSWHINSWFVRGWVTSYTEAHITRLQSTGINRVEGNVLA